MIDPAKIKPSLVEAVYEVTNPGYTDTGEYREDAVEAAAAFLNALLADDDAMGRAFDAYEREIFAMDEAGGPVNGLTAMRAAIIHAATEDDVK